MVMCLTVFLKLRTIRRLHYFFHYRMLFQGNWAFVQQYLLPSGFVWLTPHGVSLTCSSIPRFLIKWKLDVNNQLNSGKYFWQEYSQALLCCSYYITPGSMYLCLIMKDDKVDQWVNVLTTRFLQCKFFPLVVITPVV